jgi:aminopeptidase Y
LIWWQDVILAYSLQVLQNSVYERIGVHFMLITRSGHQGTLDYIYSEVAKLGDYYTLGNQTFSASTGFVAESRLIIGQSVPKSATPMGLTPPTKNKQAIDGQVLLVQNEGCDASDYPSQNFTNYIALIKRGTCPFGTKSQLAGQHGAIAAVVYNNEPGSVSGTLGTPLPDHVATFGLSQEEAAPFIAQLQNGTKLDGTAYIDGEVQNIETYNVVAQTTQGDANNCVMLGAHSDSVAEGPGINDDGSGTITLLEVATELTKFKVNNCVRFGWWAGEEEGLLGSDYYAEHLSPEENQKVRLFMDYDMLASPNFAYQVYNATNADSPAGSEELRDLYTSFYKANNIPYTFIKFDGRSDYDGFIRSGIPAGGIATGAEGVKTKEEEGLFGGHEGEWYDPCYHQLCDDVGNVNITAWEVNTKLVAHSVATYALSFDGFPARSNSSSALKSSKITNGASGKKTLYHGPKLIM